MGPRKQLQRIPSWTSRCGRAFASAALVCLATSCAILIQFRATLAVTPHELTGLDVVRAKYGFRGIGQTIAVIDTGIAYDHVALGGGLGPGFRVVGGWDFTDENDADPYDDQSVKGSHGTHVAGIVGAADGDPDTGVAPGADLVALRVFDDDGDGSFDWIENALTWVHQNRNAFANPITAVNLSLGASGNSSSPPSWANLEEELSQLKADGIFISAAAGNEFASHNIPGLGYPAASPHVVPVMSVDDTGQLSFFSQRHSRAIAAPGRLISSTVPDYAGNNDGVPDDYATFSGTNMAAPYLAGASVLVREAMGLVGYTSITQQTIYDHILATADPIFDPTTQQNYSRLNLLAAIDALIPDDDYGSTVDAAHDLGVIGPSRQFMGLIAGSDDADFFSFTAAITGVASLTTTSSHYLNPDWMIADDDQVIIDDGGSLVMFPVSAGRRYTLGLSTRAGIGHFEGAISINSKRTGDYNLDGVVTVADYATWRDTTGSTGDLRADGDGSGSVDMSDYDLWKTAFRSVMQFDNPGDFDRDGIVSTVDFTVWRDSLGSTTDLRADANRNGIVDQADYSVWKAALRSTTAGNNPGDFNRDGVVSAADYAVWRDTLGSNTDLRADANRNGMVDQGDFVVWKMYFSRIQTTPTSALAAPEPASIFLILAVVLRFSVMRRVDRRIGVRISLANVPRNAGTST